METAEITFENLTNMTQLGVEPGEEGSATVTREEAERMRDRGSIRIIGDDTIVDAPEAPVEPTPPGVPDPPELIAEEEAARGDGDAAAEETTDDEPETTKSGRGGRGR